MGTKVQKFLDNSAHTRTHRAIIWAVLPHGARLKTPTDKLQMSEACCVSECVGRAVLKGWVEREINDSVSPVPYCNQARLPPLLAIGSPHPARPLLGPFGTERTAGAVSGAGNVPGWSASVKDWQCFLQFPFPWATSSNQIQSSPYYLPLVSLIVIWKYVAKESKNRG